MHEKVSSDTEHLRVTEIPSFQVVIKIPLKRPKQGYAVQMTSSGRHNQDQDRRTFYYVKIILLICLLMNSYAWYRLVQ